MSNLFDRIETTAADTAARALPWLAPAPTAWLVGNATMAHLGWPLPIAILAAVIVEGLGLSTCYTALQFKSYNTTRRDTDPRAPTMLPAALAALYFVTALTLTVLLDTLPVVARFSPALFPLLSLAGVLTVALRADHRARLDAVQAELDAEAARQAEINAKRAETRAANRASKLARPAVHEPSILHAGTVQDNVHEPSTLDVQNGLVAPNGTNLDAANAGRKAKRARIMDAALDYLCTHPEASYSELGRHLDVSKSAASNYAGALVDAGRLKKNGKGWEPTAAEGVGQ